MDGSEPEGEPTPRRWRSIPALELCLAMAGCLGCKNMEGDTARGTDGPSDIAVHADPDCEGNESGQDRGGDAGAHEGSSAILDGSTGRYWRGMLRIESEGKDGGGFVSMTVVPDPPSGDSEFATTMGLLISSRTSFRQRDEPFRLSSGETNLNSRYQGFAGGDYRGKTHCDSFTLTLQRGSLLAAACRRDLRLHLGDAVAIFNSNQLADIEKVLTR